MLRLKHRVRPALIAGAVVVGLTAWIFTKPGGEDVRFPFPFDAAIDSPAADAAVDSAIDAPASTEWELVTIHGPESAVGLDGADGVDIATIGGNLCITTPWEQSNRVTVSCRAAGVWTTTTLATVSQVEDSKFCDVDEDGSLDVVGAGQGKRIRVWWGPSPWSSSMDIDAATNLQQWMQVACTPGRVWAGGRGTGATVGYFTSATPRVSSSWTHTVIANVDWLMSLIPGDHDADGDLDVLISDRLNGQFNRGSTWFEAPTWTKHRIYTSFNDGEPKFAEKVGANTVLVGMSSASAPNSLRKSVTSDGWQTWSTTLVAPYPSDTGWYHAVATCDLTGDGIPDHALTHSTALGALSGVVAYDGASAARIEIDHGAGEKYDNVVCVDMDDDGDLDVLTSEQNTGLGLVWFRNPRI